MPVNLAIYLLLAMLAGGFLAAALRVLREYERAVMFTLGRFTGVMGPGLMIMVPIIQQMVRVDLRMRVLDVPPQDVISRDNVSVKVNAVVYFRILQPDRSVIQVEDFYAATGQLAQTTLRSVLGRHNLDEMLTERDKLNADLQRILDEQTESWGVKISNVELKRVDLDERMIRVIARQAEAERGRRAKILEAEGEFQAAQSFLRAAEILSRRPQAMQLRYLAVPNAMANERSRTIVFPLPLRLENLPHRRGPSST
jgi:regulator of protease activity HflC (stomatin/prohibitin superfamily)